jgi:hypothetical protein
MPTTQRGPDTNDPANSFSSPLEIVYHPQLTWGMRLHTLDCWRLGIENRLLSRDENTVKTSKRDLQLINEIEQALELVLAGPSWPRTVWQP